MDAADVELVRQASAGDHSAFRVLVDRHSRRLFQMAYRMTGNREDAEDVVQDTFVKAFRQLARFEGRSSFATWLYRIGINCAVDLTGGKGRREALVTNDTLDLRRHPSGHDGFRLALAGQIAERVTTVLEDLTPQERAAFVMRHYDDCSIDEIGSALGVGTSAAKNAVFRAVRKIRVALQPFRAPARQELGE